MANWVDNDSLTNLSLEEIIKISSPVIKIYCSRHINRNYHDAEEITNDVMMKLVVRWKYVKKDKVLNLCQ